MESLEVRFQPHTNKNRTPSATKVAPPFLPFLLLWDSTPSLAEGVGGGSLRASSASVAIKRVEHSETVDCFALLAMTLGYIFNGLRLYVAFLLAILRESR